MAYELLFFDTETTGAEEKDRICQIAYSSNGKDRHEGLFKPPIPISIESMAIHHITNEMVAHKPEFKFSAEHAYFKKKLEDEKVIPVAHNAVFDISMLRKEGLTADQHICTLKIARHLDTEAVIPSYRLQYLRYYLNLPIETDRMAHDALADVIVLEKLFDRLLKKMMQTGNMSEDAAIKEMIRISSEPSLLRRMGFGKYKGQLFSQVAQTDKGYFEWMLAQKNMGGEQDEDLVYTLKYYLGKL